MIWKKIKYNCFLNVKRFKMTGKTRVKVFIFGAIWCFDFKNHGWLEKGEPK